MLLIFPRNLKNTCVLNEISIHYFSSILTEKVKAHNPKYINILKYTLIHLHIHTIVMYLGESILENNFNIPITKSKYSCIHGDRI